LTNYYVAPTGSDSNTGDITHPFLTIGKADTVVAPGDTVNVLPGTYITPASGFFYLSTVTSGTTGAHITYISTVKWGALVRTNNVNGASVGRCWQNNGDYVDIIGFDISSTDPAARIGIIHAANHCSVQQCLIHDLQAAGNFPNGGAGIGGNATSVGNQSIGNWIHHIGTLANDSAGAVQGIYCNIGDIVQNNIVFLNSGFGIHSWHVSTGLTITNNLVFENGNAGNTGGGIIVSANSAEGGNNDNTKVHNNIVLHNHGNNGAIDEFGVTGLNNTYINNLVYLNAANTGTGKMVNLLNGLVDVGTLTVDPQLVNYQGDGSGNYHLQKSSPCVNAGTSIGAPTTDFDGNPRPQNTLYDIGPYEYTPKYGAFMT